MTTQAYDGLNRPGWLTFAGVVLFAVGFLRIITAIYYFANSHRVTNLAGGALGDHLFVWGLWDLGIAVLALWAGYSLLGGNTFGRVVGYIWAIAVIVESFMIIEWAPWFGFGSLILAVFVIYALSTTSGWRESPPAT
ncbi:MAG TPA: hypothetical protein VI142_10925 [Gaiellaceae bacterium]